MGSKRLKDSFSNAFHGLVYAIRKEKNLQIELLAGFFVVIAMIAVRVEKWEAVVLVMMIGGVLILETMNTLLERLTNLLKPRVHPQARVLKDLMAAIVFLASFSAAIVGIIIFWPYLFE